MLDQSVALEPPAPITAAGKIAVIADVHGESALLRSALSAIEDKSRTKLVLLGDLIDRGPDSRGCLRIARELETSGEFREVVILPGNHEQMAVWSTMSNDWAGSFLANGGTQTFAEFGYDDGAMLAAMPDQIRDRLSGKLPLWHQDGNLLFVHAGIHPQADTALFLDGPQAREMNPARFMEDASPLWIRRPFLSNPHHRGPYLSPEGEPVMVVHGHTRLGTANSNTAIGMIRGSIDTWRIPLDATASGFLPLLEIDNGKLSVRLVTTLAVEPLPSL